MLSKHGVGTGRTIEVVVGGADVHRAVAANLFITINAAAATADVAR